MPGEHEVKLDVISSDERPVEMDEFHRWLTENLPRFMLPRYLELRPVIVGRNIPYGGSSRPRSWSADGFSGP